MRSRLLGVAFAAVVTTAVMQPAEAQSTETYAFTIDVAKADTRPGAQAIYAAIIGEASRQCRSKRRSWAGRRVFLECRDAIIDHAVAMVDMPLITATHNATAPRRRTFARAA